MSTNSYTTNISQALHIYTEAKPHTVRINDALATLQISWTNYENNKNIKYIKTGNSLTSITSRCFQGAENLISVDLPYVKVLTTYAFTGCKNLKSINAPQLTAITPTYMLSGCRQLTSFYVNNANLKSIDNGHGLQHTVVVDSTGKQLKAVCPSITEFTNETLTALTSTAFLGSNLSSIYVPNVKTIAVYAFRECNNLISCNFSQLTGTLGVSAFAGCQNLEYIKFNNLTAFGANTFTNCPKLKIIDCSERTSTSIPTVQTTSFTNDFGVKIIIPDSLYSAWSTSGNWPTAIQSGQVELVKKTDY